MKVSVAAKSKMNMLTPHNRQCKRNEMKMKYTSTILVMQRNGYENNFIKE